MEEAGTGKAGGSVEDFLGVWDKLVESIEVKWRDLPLQRHLVPLHQHDRRYATLRWRTCQQAANTAAQIAASKSAPPTGNIRIFHEIPVTTTDGLISGIIDYARETPGGTLLRDIKTGTIWDQESAENGTPEIKDDYQVQLKLYAVLWHSKTGEWPLRLELAPQDGEPVEVPFTPEECDQLESDARIMLEQANAAIEAALHTMPPDLAGLASPSPQVCQYCVFRPGCAAYWRAREQPLPLGAKQWSKDFCGTLQKQHVLGNGQMMLQIGGEGDQKIHVRLKPDADRYPALQDLRAGCAVAFYNLAASGGAWSESDYTALYSG